MSSFNLFIPPYTPDTINMAFGLSGPGSQPLNNLNDLWLKATQNLQKGDLMVCSGDFVQACVACCLGKVETDKKGKKTYVADEEILKNYANQFSVNGHSVKVCDPSCQANLENPKTYKNGAPFSCDINSNQQNCQECTVNNSSNPNDVPGMCLTGCMNNYANKCEGTFDSCKTDSDCKDNVKCVKQINNFPATDNDLDLFEELKAALKRGAYICFVIDSNFFVNVFPDTKIQSDFVFYQLREISEQTKQNNFLWFNLPPHGVKNPITEDQMYVHAKICTAFYWGTDRTIKYLYSSLGSFNPSFPISLTLEIGSCITGILGSPVIEQISLFTYAFLVNANLNHKGDFNNNNWGESWTILETMFLNNFQHWTLKFPSINTNGILTNIKFCGKLFTYGSPSSYDPLKDSKYVSFLEKNVTFFLGAEGAVSIPDQKLGNTSNAYSNILPWGLTLMRNVISETDEYLKIGYYGNFLDCDANSGTCGKGSGTLPWLINDSMKNVLNDPSKTTYIIQKPNINNVKCTDTSEKDQNKCKIESISEQLWPLTSYRGSNKNFFYKWYMKTGLHWKFLMTDNSIFLSSQHPIKYFYGTGDPTDRSSTHGYDLVLKTCPNILEYFNNMYNYIWDNRSYYTTDELKRLDIEPKNFPVFGASDLFSRGATVGKNGVNFNYRDVSCELDFPSGCPVSTGINCKKLSGEMCGSECGDVDVCMQNPDCCFDFDAAKKGKGNGVPWCFQKIEPKPTQSPTHAPTQSPTHAPTQSPTQSPTHAPTQSPEKKSTNSSKGMSQTTKDILIFLVIISILGIIIFMLIKNNVIAIAY